MSDPTVTSLATRDATRLAALIREQSTAEVSEVQEQGRERIQRLRAAAEAEAQQIREAAQRDGAAQGRRRAAELMARAEAAAHMQWLRAREVLLDAVLERVRAQLDDLLARPDAGAVIADLIQEALDLLPDEPLQLLAPAPYASLLDEALRDSGGGERVAAAGASGPVPGGGVILQTADGRLRCDNSFDARIRRNLDRLRRIVADELFAQTEMQQ